MKRLSLSVFPIATALLLIPVMLHAQTAPKFTSLWLNFVAFAPNENAAVQGSGPIEGITIVTNGQEYDFRAPLFLSDFLSKDLENGELPDVAIKITLKKGIRITQVIPANIDMTFDIKFNGESCESIPILGDYCATIIGWLHDSMVAPPKGVKYDNVKGVAKKSVVSGNDPAARKKAVKALNELSQDTIFANIPVYSAIKTDPKTGGKYIIYILDKQKVLSKLRDNRKIVQELVRGLAIDVRAAGSKKIIISRERNRGLGLIRP